MTPDVEIELFELSFSNENSRTITFGKSFRNIPTVTVISSGNENMYVSNINKNSCSINASTRVTATIRVQVIGYV